MKNINLESQAVVILIVSLVILMVTSFTIPPTSKKVDSEVLFTSWCPPGKKLTLNEAMNILSKKGLKIQLPTVLPVNYELKIVFDMGCAGVDLYFLYSDSEIEVYDLSNNNVKVNL